MTVQTPMRWVCTVCGYVHEGPEPPQSCPECDASADLFEAEEPADSPCVDAPATRWICTVCGYVHEGPEPPEECLVCAATSDLFEKEAVPARAAPARRPTTPPIDTYLSEWARTSDDFEEKYVRIRDLAVTGKSTSSAMRTQRPFPGWESVLFRGGSSTACRSTRMSRLVPGPSSEHRRESPSN